MQQKNLDLLYLTVLGQNSQNKASGFFIHVVQRSGAEMCGIFPVFTWGNFDILMVWIIVFLKQDVHALVSRPGKSGLKSEALFKEIGKRISDHPELVKKVKGIFEWNITKGGKTAGQWTVDLKTGSGSVTEGPHKQGKADCTITVEDDDLAAIAMGKANPQELFIKSKLKVKGNIMLTTKLGQLFKDQAKL